MKIRLKILIGVLAVSAVFVGGYSTYRYVQNIPTRINSLDGLKLGMTKDDVLYLKGLPRLYWDNKESYSSITKKDRTDLVSETVYAGAFYGEEKSSSKIWGYEGELFLLDIFFDTDRDIITSIKCTSKDNVSKLFHPCELYHVGIDSYEDEIFNIFGIPDEEIVKDGFKRVSYRKFNLQFLLKMRRIESIKIVADMNLDDSNLMKF